MQLSEAIRDLCIATSANGRSPRTVDAYREKCGYMLAFLGDGPVESITTADLRRYVADMRERLSGFTVASRTRAFKRLFRWLQTEDLLNADPARPIPVREPQRTQPNGIVEADLAALLRSTEGDDLADVRDRAIILLLADSGCRVGGLAGLTVADLDLKRRMALVTEKGGKSRYIMFMDLTAEALRRWLEVRPTNAGPWLFVRLRGHEPGRLRENGIAEMLKRRGKQAGCTGHVNPHAFRHGFARSYLLDGGGMVMVSKLLGHASLDITARYYAVFDIGELQTMHGQHSPVAIMGREEYDDAA